MSPIAKLFIVLNVVLAGVFLGFAAKALNTESSYKIQYDTEKKAGEDYKTSSSTEKAKILADKAEVEKARDAMQGERDAARAEIERLKNQVADQERANNEMRASVDKIAKSIDDVMAKSNALSDARDKAVQAQRDAEKARDEAIAARAASDAKAGELETKLHSSEGQVSDLEKTSTSLKKEVDKLNTNLASLQAATNVKLDEIVSLPQIDGRVLEVSSAVDPGLISINKGEADGVKRGFTFEIYDGKTYKGQARVEYVHQNSCSALLIRPVQGQKVRQGDSASTRI
jgi:predicted  nucleic acid-binding Zn-ribbon protein